MKASIIVFGAFCASFFQAGFASARETKSVQDFIKKAYQKGEIDVDEALVLQARSILQPETLPEIWKAYPIEASAGRYLTHLLCDIRLNWEKLREETRKALQPLLLRPTDASYVVFGVDWAYAAGTTVLNFETTHFVIHYVNTTADSPSLTDDDSDGHPNYVESMGTEFENVYTNEITTMGYNSPPGDGTLGGNSKFDVYIKNIGSASVYGWVHAEGSASALIQIQGISDPDGDQVFIEVNEIMQDEPVVETGIGAGSNCPDAVYVDGDGDEIPELFGIRVERGGNPNVPGNGRVYTITFTARDSKGAACSGIVKTCAAHDQGINTICIDDGGIYDSTFALRAQADLLR